VVNPPAFPSSTQKTQVVADNHHICRIGSGAITPVKIKNRIKKIAIKSPSSTMSNASHMAKHKIIVFTLRAVSSAAKTYHTYECIKYRYSSPKYVLCSMDNTANYRDTRLKKMFKITSAKVPSIKATDYHN
jgi:hypothetical protein